eukprot:281410-Rhodomonas_salina.1
MFTLGIEGWQEADAASLDASPTELVLQVHARNRRAFEETEDALGNRTQDPSPCPDQVWFDTAQSTEVAEDDAVFR